MNTKRTNRSAQDVKDIRSLMKEEYENNKDKYYEKDYQRVLNDDWYVKRFLLSRNRKKNEAFVMIKTALAWRKKMQVCELLDYKFPVEFYKIGGLFIYEKDKQENVVVYMRICLHQKISELEPFVKKFLIHVIDKADNISKGSGVAIIFDLTNAGYSNVDLEILKYLILIGSNYFPFVVSYILVHNMPWILNAVRKIVFSFLPQDWINLIKFSSGDEIFNYVDISNLPDYLGGTCKRNFRAVPKGSPFIEKIITEYGYNKSDFDRLIVHFEKTLKEADLLCESNEYFDPIDFFDEPPTLDGVLIPSNLNTTIVSKVETKIPLKINDSKIIVPKEITFFFDPNQNLFVADIIIQNCYTNPIAFRVQSNNPKMFLVSPRLGIILSHLSLKITIKLKSDKSLSVESSKFLILTLPFVETKMNEDDFDQLWLIRKNEINSFKVSCRKVLVEKSMLRHPELILENHIEQLSKNLNIIQQQQQKTMLLIHILLILLISFIFLFILSHSDLFQHFKNYKSLLDSIKS